MYVMDSEEEGDEDYHWYFQLAIQQSLGFESQNAEDGGDGVSDEPGFGAQTDEPFAEDEMRESTQEEIDMDAQFGAARNTQYALEDKLEEQLIKQVRPHPHFFGSFQLYKRCWGKPTRHQHRTLRRHLKYCP